MSESTPSAEKDPGITMDWALDADAFRDWILRKTSAAAWERADGLRSRGSLRFWLAAGSVPQLQDWMRGLLEGTASAEAGLATPEARARCERAWSAVRIYTVDARSVAEALAEDGDHLETRIALANFRRFSPQGVFISFNSPISLTSRDAAPGSPVSDPGMATGPEEALQAFDREASLSTPRVPMLDLQAEYRELAPELDRVLIKAAADAQYISGPLVTRFEEELAAYLGAGTGTGARHAIGVSSGTEAVVLALRSLALTRFGQERFAPTDLILTTPFTFVATGDAILRAGATPLFVDIDPATLNLDVTAARRYLDVTSGKDGRRAVGIIPVHLFGQSCPMQAVLDLAAERNLFVVEDVAQAFGASWKGRKLGAIGEMGAFSFFPSKNLGGFGDAGAVTTDDADLAAAVRRLVKHGGVDKYRFEVLGYNARLDSLQAGVLSAKLPRVDGNNGLRMDIARRYLAGLEGVPGLALPAASGPDGSESVFHQFTLRTPRRAGLQKHLEALGIASMVYYPHPLHRMPLFQGRQVLAEAEPGSGLPEAERAAEEVLSLPMGPAMTAHQVDAVVAGVLGFMRKPPV